MTLEATSIELLNSCNRWNSILYDQKGLYTDGIKNLSDLKNDVGGKNGELWVNNFSYTAGDIVSFNNEVYISLQNNNVGNLVDNTSCWKRIENKNLVQGDFYAGAFCNCLMGSNYVLTLSNNFNIASVSYQSQGQGVQGGIHLLNFRFKEGANISNKDYMVFPSISYNLSVVNNNVIRRLPTQIQVYDKKITGFTLVTEYFPTRELSVVIVPKQ